MGATSADHEIHVAVFRVNDYVSERERASTHKFLDGAFEASPVGDKMDGIHRPIGPIVDEESVLIFAGEFSSGSDNNASRAAGANIGGGRKSVGVVAGPFPSSRTPTGIESTDRMINAGGAIPGRTNVPFHIGIEGEEFAILIKGGIEFIPESVGDHFNLLGIRISLENETTRSELSSGVAIGVPHAGKEMIFRPSEGRAGTIQFCRHIGMVSEDEVERFSVGAGDDAMESMLATALEFAEKFFFIELAVIVGVAQTIEPVLPLLFVLEDVEGVEDVTEAVGSFDLGLELFDLGCRIRKGDAIEPAVLISRDEAALRINRHGDPRALLGLRHGVEFFGGKARKRNHLPRNCFGL